MICCGFIVCWSPSGIFDLLMLVGVITDASGWYINMVMTMAVMNCFINPFIYAAKYREFQTGVRRLLRMQVVEPYVQTQPVEMEIQIVGRVAGCSLNTDRPP